MALLGVSGFLVAVLYVLLGAPDLGLTQLLIETLTVVLIVLVFRRLPVVFRRVSVTRRLGAAAVAVTMGLLAAAGTHALTGRRGLSEVGAYFLKAASEEAGGSNVVKRRAILVRLWVNSVSAPLTWKRAVSPSWRRGTCRSG